MRNQRILIIGGGNMGTAVLQSLLHLRGVSAQDIMVIERASHRRQDLASRFSVRTRPNLTSSILSQSSILLVAVKPQDFPDIAAGVKRDFSRTGLLISIMAGVGVSTLRSSTGCSRIVRVMPNLPMIAGKGFSAWYASRAVTNGQKIFTRAFLSAGGQEVEVKDEKLFDAITAVSGSGPAYVFSLAADLMAAAVRLGIETGVAKKMVTQTIKGSIALLEQSADSPDKWRRRVTSKGGTTAAAFHILDKAHLDKLWYRALTAAARRSHSLSVLIDKQLRKQ